MCRLGGPDWVLGATSVALPSICTIQVGTDPRRVLGRSYELVSSVPRKPWDAENRVKQCWAIADTCSVHLPEVIRPLRIHVLIGVLLVIGVLAVPSIATGDVASTSWTGEAGSLGDDRYDWTDPANWSDGLPTAGANVTIAPTVTSHIYGVPDDLSLGDLKLGGSEADVSLHPAEGTEVVFNAIQLIWRSGTIGAGLTLGGDLAEFNSVDAIVAAPSDPNFPAILEGSFHFSGGALEIEQDAVLELGANPAMLGTGDTLYNYGTIRFRADSGSTLTLDCVALDSRGLIELGRNRIVVGGPTAATQLVITTGATIEAEIGGTTVGTDLGGIVQGTEGNLVFLDGTLRLRQLPGYEPSDGTEFPIIEMPDGSVVPVEAEFELPGPGWSVDWNLSHVTATFDRRTSAADLELQADGPRRAVRNEPFVMLAVVQNLGPEHALGTRFTATLDDDVRLLDASAAGPCWGVRIVRCNIDELDPSGNAAIRLVMSARRVGKILTRSSVSSLSLDENETNDVVRLRTSIAAP
jgi:hypothetical protein